MLLPIHWHLEGQCAKVLMCSSSASFYLNQAGPQKISMPTGKVLSLPFPMRVLLRRFWGENFWMKVKMGFRCVKMVLIRNGRPFPSHVQDGGREAFHRLCALCVTRCLLSRRFILLVPSWRLPTAHGKADATKFHQSAKDFDLWIRNDTDSHHHSEIHQMNKIMVISKANLNFSLVFSKDFRNMDSRIAGCCVQRQKSQVSPKRVLVLVQRCQWSRWTYDPTGPLTLKALNSSPPFGCLVPWRSSKQWHENWKDFPGWQSPHDRWLSEEALFLRDVAFLCKSSARQVPFSVSLSVRVPVVAGWIHETVTISPPHARFFLQEPIVKAKGWCGQFFLMDVFSAVLTLWHLLTWFSPLVLGSSKTEDFHPCRKLSEAQGDQAFSFFFFWQLIFVLQLLPTASCHSIASSVQEDEAQHPFGSYRPGQKENHGDA